MELKAGYKQTEVGVIPADWEVLPIGNIATVTSGGTPSRQVAEYWDGDIPWATTTEVNSDTILETAQSITAIGLANSAAKLLAPGALLMALYGQGKTRGKVAVLGIRASTNQACAAIVLSPTVSKMFVFHFLVSQYSAIRGLSNSGSQENLSGGIVKAILVPFPPTKTEQEAIAEALSDADALIESLDQLITKKRHLKQGAMQELLTGKRRLPGFSGEWEVRRLGDVIEKFVGGGTPSRSNPAFWGEEIPWVTVKDFATFNPRQAQESITKLGLLSSASHLITKGTLITSTRMALGKAVIYEVDVAINQDLKALFPIAALSANYLYFWFQYHGQTIDDLGSGSTVKGISLPDLKKIEFGLPSISEQTAIATILNDMDTELAELDSRLAKARQIKQGMMQELLTGRIRLL